MDIIKIIKQYLILLIALTVACISNAQAALLTQDLYSTNDELITIDTTSQLEWLDLTATNGVSVVDVASGYGGYFNEGFRYATHSEVLNLYTNAGIVGFDPDPFYHTASLTENYSPIETLISLMGCTATCDDTPNSFPYGHRPVLAGTYGATPNAVNFENRYFSSSYISMQISSSRFPAQDGTGTAAIGNRSSIAKGAYEGYGSFLVREATVPEPSTLLLFSIGVLGIRASRRPA